jgi:flagellar hook-associated protein 3 FlgL
VRVTDRLVYDRSAREMGRGRETVDEARALVASGRRVNHPGDDPATAGALAAFQVSSARNAAMSRAADLAARELGAADGALGSVGNVLSRARELAVQFSSDGYPGEQRAMGAAEVGTLVTSAIASLNARYGNRWIFGGTADDAPPFDAATGAYLGAVGDDGARQVEIAPGVLQASAVRADRAIRGDGGGVDVIATLKALQTALRDNDVAGVRAALTPLDSAITQVATARADAGVAMDAIGTAGEAAKLAAEDEQMQLAQLSEVGLPEATTRLAQAQAALEASMSAAAQSFRITLLDYLR